jgi:hypothetical protein
LIGFHHTCEWHNPTSHQPLAGTVALQWSKIAHKMT